MTIISQQELANMNIRQHLHAKFGTEFDALTAEHRARVLHDFQVMLRKEYDVPSPNVAYDVELESIQAAAAEYARRLGAGNLAFYARCLAPARKLPRPLQNQIEEQT